MKILINENGTVHSFYDDTIQVEAAEGQTLFHASGYHSLEIGQELPATLTTTEAKLHSLRIERNRLLVASDWTQLPDSPLSEVDRSLWAVYRQALRDMTETVEDLDAPVWPGVPG